MSKQSIVERMTCMTSLVELRSYYLYSLRPNKFELCFIFGNDDGEKYYQEALKNEIQPTVRGFINYIKEYIKRNPNVIIIPNKTIKQTRKWTTTV